MAGTVGHVGTAGEGLGELDPTVLMAAASAEAHLEDYGDERFVEPLTRLMHAVVSEANLSPTGVMGVQASVVRCLVNRLRLQDDLKKHPEILDEDVADPIVVVGLPRTGTTKLQRMLSCDPGVQRLPLWRLLNPAPLPGWKPGEPDERVAIAVAYAEALGVHPDFMALHPMMAEETDEDVFLMEMAFEGVLPVLQFHVPSFHAWWKDRDRHDFYAFERLLLRYLQWQDGGRRDRPWVLKAQTHLGGLEALIDTFPSATLVHCHRDVVELATSVLRTAEEFRRLLADEIDLAEHGADVLQIYADEVARYVGQRDRLGPRARIVDVHYGDILHNPIGVIRDVNRVHGRALTPEAERRMVAWEQENPQHRFGKVPYSLERYDVTKDRIEELFAPYLARFGPWLQSRATTGR